MVTDRYERPHGVQPASLTAALGLSAAMVGGLVMSSPAVQDVFTKPFIGINIPLAQPKPEPTLDIKTEVRLKPHPSPMPKPVDATRPLAPVDLGTFVPTGGVIGATGSDPIVLPLPPLPTPTPAPVLTEATIDPRFARDVQPLYPAGEQRAGRVGRVTIRVLVGADGRVKEAQRVATDSDAFWTATQHQALSKWRFRPATRDGVAIEAWRTMTVRFEMTE